jgi:hypothetical protein
VLEALTDDGVDSVIVAFACVGECRPERVIAAVAAAVDAGEARGGVAKPVLLCIMGAVGTVDAARGDSRRVFPAYLFPESAPRALARVVRYVAFRSQPPGRLALFEGVDAAAARRELQAALAEAGEDPVALEPGVVERVLAAFGLRVAGGAGVVQVRVRSDRLFGPLLEVARPGAAPVERITPLTDRDVAQVLAMCGLADEAGVAEAVGRLSQLVDELPWVWSVETAITPGSPPTLAAATAIAARRVASAQASRP